ncbi:hypothetical protein TNCT_99421 [Trichonephila clavata]|uniref:Uncharacterized protein n=1 Tax=Trichonephila clavata TaxID=2740835 RepID=A0A8X6F5I8_TRICU|nr:hypothetical protein TNCT_99421 [Trichonephila clavata]
MQWTKCSILLQICQKEYPIDDTSTPFIFATNSSDETHGNFFRSFSVESLQLRILFLHVLLESKPCLFKNTNDGTDE